MLTLPAGLALAAFIAGVLMFFAPCTLPLVPAYLAFIAGTDERALRTGGREGARRLRRAVLRSAVAFTLGFSVVFVSFGLLAGLAGSLAGALRDLLTPLAGGLIVIFGLVMLGLVRLPVFASAPRLTLPAFLTPGTPTAAALVGGSFALGWTPCIGPVLASVLLFASSTSTALSGALLLAFFSFGLALPFLATAFFYDVAVRAIGRAGPVSRVTTLVGGTALVSIGLLLVTGHFGLLLAYGTPLFSALGLDALFRYY